MKKSACLTVADQCQFKRFTDPKGDAKLWPFRGELSIVLHHIMCQTSKHK